jgi:hypothetical protein
VYLLNLQIERHYTTPREPISAVSRVKHHHQEPYFSTIDLCNSDGQLALVGWTGRPFDLIAWGAAMIGAYDGIRE